jgi:F0F1-type ATP synthase delta subunit
MNIREFENYVYDMKDKFEVSELKVSETIFEKLRTHFSIKFQDVNIDLSERTELHFLGVRIYK